MTEYSVAAESEELEALTVSNVAQFPSEPDDKEPDDESNDVFWAYLAGLIDGDGTIVPSVTLRTRVKGKPQRYRRNILVGLTMCDLDILEHVKACSKMGHIYVERRPGEGNATKIAYRWVVTARGDATVLLENIFPYLGARKSGKALEMMELIEHWNLLGVEKAKAKAEAAVK